MSDIVIILWTFKVTFGGSVAHKMLKMCKKEDGAIFDVSGYS